jgi:hypothetical protein
LHHARAALAGFRAAGHEVGQGLALNAAGWAHARLDNFADARDHCRQALGLHQMTDNQTAEAETWDSLGYAWHGLGRLDLAEDSYRRSLDLFRRLGDLHCEARALVNLGETRLAAADLGGHEDLAAAAVILARLGFGDQNEIDGWLPVLTDAAPFIRVLCDSRHDQLRRQADAFARDLDRPGFLRIEPLAGDQVTTHGDTSTVVDRIQVSTTDGTPGSTLTYHGTPGRLDVPDGRRGRVAGLPSRRASDLRQPAALRRDPGQHDAAEPVRQSQ